MIRRTVLSLSLAALTLIAPVHAVAHPIDLEPVPSRPSPISTPTIEREPVDVQKDIRALVDSPWEYETRPIEFNAVVEARYIADEGYGYEVGIEGRDVYRTFLLVQVRDRGNPITIAVATDDDLSNIEGRHTARITGMYGGLQEYNDGGIWTVPLVIASKVEPIR